ncbi:MAG: YqeG family HAD IIIA-type phosphatase [Methylocystaceae bacterium]
MKHILHPNLFVDNLWDVPLSRLKAEGIAGILLDLDNTLTHWNGMQVSPEAAAWVKLALEQGFNLCLLSNNGPQRVMPVANELGIPFVADAGKPRRHAFHSAIKVLNLPREQVAAVGDQLFTDVLGGNRTGIYTVLVTPLDKMEFIGTRFMRKIEGLFRARLTKFIPPGDD